jgi:hypothetical protein
LPGKQDRVLMKLIVSQADTRKVLGCHIVAPEAGEMIQLAAIAMKMGATKEDFDRTVCRASDHGRRTGDDAQTGRGCSEGACKDGSRQYRARAA